MSAEKTVLVAVANGTEEIESIAVVDTLRRAGANVTVASVEPADAATGLFMVTMSRGVRVIADCSIADCAAPREWDAVVVPGGMPGSEHLRDSAVLRGILASQYERKGHIAAICAAPVVVLQHHGFLDGCTKATCTPSMFAKLAGKGVEDRVVTDGGFITTSRGPGTTLEFALRIVELLYSKEHAAKIGKPMFAM